MLKAAAAAAAEPGNEREKQIHQQHFERAMADVLAAKSVMQQSLFREDNAVLYDPPWRRQLIAATLLAGSALLASVIALVMVLLR